MVSVSPLTGNVMVVSGVFVSHASADVDFVEPFVSNVLELGCGLEPHELFYSSGADTGVPDGADLMAYVRRKVGSANLVIALITPTYLTRPVCMAELGAAWGVVGDTKLFPLLSPGMERKELDGILPSLLIRYADDREALDQLHERVSTAVLRHSSTPTWGRHVRKWEKDVKVLAQGLAVPSTVSAEEMKRLEGRVADANKTIDAMEEQLKELQEQLDAVSKLKDPVQVARVKLPKENRQRFDALVDQAGEALDKLRPVVREAIRSDVLGSVMYWPDGFEDQDARREAQRAYDSGELIDGYADETLVPDYDFASASSARDALRDLLHFLTEEAEPDLFEIFKLDHGMPLDLNKRPVWDALFG